MTLRASPTVLLSRFRSSRCSLSKCLTVGLTEVRRLIHLQRLFGVLPLLLFVDVHGLRAALIVAAVARIYGEWRVNPRLALKAQIENAVNEHYQPVNGYPALGFGAFGSVECKL